MDHNGCEKCGKAFPDAAEALCPECKGAVKQRGRKRFWYSSVAVAILLVAGAALLYAEKPLAHFSWDALLGRPAALVNGEPISRAEADERVGIARMMIEKSYGKGIFAGERGQALLGRLEGDVLEKIVEERLVAQQAEQLKIRVEDERVRQEIEQIGREIYGSRDHFQASLKEDGISERYLTNHVRNRLLRRELQKAQTPPDRDPDAYFAAWLTKQRKIANVSLYQTIKPSSALSGTLSSCCGSGGTGGCGTGRNPGAPDPALQSQASAAALDRYRKSHPAEKGLATKVTDFGCHLQVDIVKEGITVASYSYSEGKVEEI